MSHRDNVWMLCWLGFNSSNFFTNADSVNADMFSHANTHTMLYMSFLPYGCTIRPVRVLPQISKDWINSHRHFLALLCIFVADFASFDPVEHLLTTRIWEKKCYCSSPLMHCWWCPNQQTRTLPIVIVTELLLILPNHQKTLTKTQIHS